MPWMTPRPISRKTTPNSAGPAPAEIVREALSFRFGRGARRGRAVCRALRDRPASRPSRADCIENAFDPLARGLRPSSPARDALPSAGR